MATTQTFPSSLSHTIVYPMVISPRQGRTRVNFESGYNRQRLRFNHEPTNVTLNFRFFPDEWETAQDFFSLVRADYFNISAPNCNVDDSDTYDLRMMRPPTYNNISYNYFHCQLICETRAARQDTACETGTCNESFTPTTPGTRTTTFPSTYLDRLTNVTETIDPILLRDTDSQLGNEQMRNDYAHQHLFATMTFELDYTLWKSFHAWLRASGYYWFTMSLPNPAAGSSLFSNELVRFVSDPVYTYSKWDYYKVTLQAEIQPYAGT